MTHSGLLLYFFYFLLFALLEICFRLQQLQN